MGLWLRADEIHKDVFDYRFCLGVPHDSKVACLPNFFGSRALLLLKESRSNALLKEWRLCDSSVSHNPQLTDVTVLINPLSRNLLKFLCKSKPVNQTCRFRHLHIPVHAPKSTPPHSSAAKTQTLRLLSRTALPFHRSVCCSIAQCLVECARRLDEQS